jgi:copper transport protein
MRRIATTLLLAVAVVALTAAPALAHVDLASSNPEAGSVITEPLDSISLEFTIPAVIAGDGIVLYGGDAEPLDAQVEQISDTLVVVIPVEPLTDGRYAVTWSMQSGDAHPVSNGIEFSIALPTPTTVVEATPDTTPASTNPPGAVTASADVSLLDSVLEQAGSPFGQVVTAVGRAAAIAAALIGIGALAFGALVLRGTRREAETVGYWMRRSGAAVMVSAPVILVGRLLDTGTGGLESIGFELALQVAGGLALFAGTRIVTMPDPTGPPSTGGGTATLTQQRFRVGSSPLALAGIAALVLSFALDGHSGALEPTWLMTVASMVHVIAAAVWVGGVALIGRTLMGRARNGEPLATGSLVIPFSVVAAVAVTAVGLAGLVMTFVIIDGLGTLFTTPWGWAMLSKRAARRSPVRLAADHGCSPGRDRVPRARGDDHRSARRPVRGLALLVCPRQAPTISGMTMRLLRIITLTLAASLVLVACGGSDTAVVETVDPATANGYLDESGTVLLDIRTPGEFAEARLDGAVNIDFYEADFADQIDALDKDTTYVVYCRSDNRSGQAMDLFRELGFTEVYEIDGGIVNWIQAGLPTVSG